MRLSRQKKQPAPTPPPPASTAPTGFGRRTRLPPVVKDTNPSKRRFFKPRPDAEAQAGAPSHGGAVGVALVGFGIGALMLARGKKRGA